jgi:hypothetical protein
VRLGDISDQTRKLNSRLYFKFLKVVNNVVLQSDSQKQNNDYLLKEGTLDKETYYKILKDLDDESTVIWPYKPAQAV